MAKRRRINEIDLLRFVAALSVVLYHYSFRGHAGDDLSVMPYPVLDTVARYGYLGVDLFFLISGFVILMTASSGSLKDFVISRAVRLYPAFWACCSLTFLVLLFASHPTLHVSASQYAVNLTMLNGFIGIPSIDGVYWSLFIELQFYALVAVVLATGRIHRAEMLLLLWLVAVMVVEAFVPSGKLRFLLIADYAAEFIAGAMAFLILSKGPSVLRLFAFATAWIVAVCQSLDRVDANEQYYHTDWNATGVIVLITVIFAVMLMVATGRTGALGRRNWLLIGSLTYPLYLLHENVGYVVFNAAYPTVNPHILLWGTLALMLLAAYAIHRLVERKLGAPMKRVLNRGYDVTSEWIRGWKGAMRPVRDRLP